MHLEPFILEGTMSEHTTISVMVKTWTEGICMIQAIIDRHAFNHFFTVKKRIALILILVVDSSLFFHLFFSIEISSIAAVKI